MERGRVEEIGMAALAAIYSGRDEREGRREMRKTRKSRKRRTAREEGDEGWRYRSLSDISLDRYISRDVSKAIYLEIRPAFLEDGRTID
jgi:hypothetical protein